MRGGLLAAGCWLLAASATGCDDQGVAPTSQVTAPDSADQILEGMDTRIVADGVRRSTVLADTAYIYQDRQVADMRNVTAMFYDLQGNQTSVLTSQRGEYYINLGTLEARGNVKVVSTDGSNRRLTTEHLIYDRNLNQIRSDSAFVYESPTEVLRGTSFYSDPDFRNLVTRQPRGRQIGGGAPIPGQ